MAGINIGYTALPHTFTVDIKGVRVKIKRGLEFVLRKQLYTVMRTGQRLLKTTKDFSKHAPPGSPPFSHPQTGEPLKNFLRYDLAPDGQSGIVGPKRLPGKKGEAPKVLEHGGFADVPTGRRWVTRNGHRQTEARFVGTDLQPRPFMGPALAQAQPKLAAFWRNAITA